MGLGEGRGLFLACWSHHCEQSPVNMIYFRHACPCSGWKKWTFQRFPSVTLAPNGFKYLSCAPLCCGLSLPHSWGGKVGASDQSVPHSCSWTHCGPGPFNTSLPRGLSHVSDKESSIKLQPPSLYCLNPSKATCPGPLAPWACYWRNDS